MSENKTCLTCNAKYCRYNDPLNKYNQIKFDYLKLFDCRNNQYCFWQPKERQISGRKI